MEVASDIRKGDMNPMWNGGLAKHSSGYVYKKCEGHPFSNNGYVLEHRLVMEEKLKRENPGSEYLIKLGDILYLSQDYSVHHVDSDKKNNDDDNLVVMTNSNHARYHRSCKLEKGEYWPNTIKLPVIKYNPESKKHELKED